jgi:hypothetical protein
MTLRLAALRRRFSLRDLQRQDVEAVMYSGWLHGQAEAISLSEITYILPRGMRCSLGENT